MFADGGDKYPFVQELIAKNRPIKPEDVEPELWVSGAHLVELYFQIREWCPENGMGVSPVTMSVMDDYCRHSNSVLEFNIRTGIKKIDRIFRSSFNESRK